MKTKLFLFLIALISLHVTADEIYVPADYSTIQEAILMANNGDIIIVDNGIYYENINFFTKEVMVTSNYHLTGDISDIQNTIIDGSQTTDENHGSCVTFSNGESQNAILKGFTITGGTGTKTYNAAEDLYFRTGGGILIDNSSPTIINNIIRDNECIAEDGVFGAGGGGIRMGFGQPIIENNIIKNNIGGYAGGIMIAYCGGITLKNNLVAYNTATGSFNGGGGIYVDWESITLENNTIVNNHSGDKGGGIISTGTTTVIKNCIIYGNTATNGFEQIFKRYGGNANVTYTAIEDGFDGSGNEEGVITSDPLFDNTNNFLLSSSSPCIDGGNPDGIYNDIEDPNSSGNALFPSQGTVRNDMGVYGGQGAIDFLSITEINTIEGIDFNFVNPYTNNGIRVTSSRNTTFTIKVYSYLGQLITTSENIAIEKGITIIPLEINSSSIAVFEETQGKGKVLKLIIK